MYSTWKNTVLDAILVAYIICILISALRARLPSGSRPHAKVSLQKFTVAVRRKFTVAVRRKFTIAVQQVTSQKLDKYLQSPWHSAPDPVVFNTKNTARQRLSRLLSIITKYHRLVPPQTWPIKPKISKHRATSSHRYVLLRPPPPAWSSSCLSSPQVPCLTRALLPRDNMSIAPVPVANPVLVSLVKPVPRNWASKGNVAGVVPNGHGHGQDESGMPLDRWFNEGQDEAPWDNAGAVVEAVWVAEGNGMDASSSAGQQ